MSKIEVNELAVRSGTNITFSSPIQGEGTAGTTLNQGLTKMWVNYTGISTTAARDSFNVSSLTDNATGRTTITITNNMGNVNYSGYYYQNGDTGTGYTNFNNAYAGGFSSFTAGSCGNNTQNSSGDVDSYQNLCGIVGDLA